MIQLQVDEVVIPYEHHRMVLKFRIGLEDP